MRARKLDLREPLVAASQKHQRPARLLRGELAVGLSMKPGLAGDDFQRQLGHDVVVQLNGEGVVAHRADILGQGDVAAVDQETLLGQ